MDHFDDTETGALADVPFLTERELASLWNISTRTLQRWRANGTGPKFVRIGDSVRYRPRDARAYEEDGNVS